MRTDVKSVIYYLYQKYRKKERKGENAMRKKLLTAVMTAIMVMCLGITPAFADSTKFETGTVTNYNGTYTYRAMSSYPNTKATANANWFLNVSYIHFDGTTANSYGMMFRPMLRSGNSSYTEVGADIAKTKTTMSTKYYSWNGHGPANITYYLGVRLDSVLTNTSGSASGYWNAN